MFAPHVRRRTEDGRRVRALDIIGKDRVLLKAISDPAFTVSDMATAFNAILGVSTEQHLDLAA